MTVGNNGTNVRNIILDARNDGVCVYDIMMSSRNGCICVYRVFLLEVELAMATAQATKRTLKT